MKLIFLLTASVVRRNWERQAGGLVVYLHENFVQMPLPLGPSPHPIGALSPDLCSKHRAKSVPPEPHCFVTQIDPALMQQIFDVTERWRKPNIHHDG